MSETKRLQGAEHVFAHYVEQKPEIQQPEIKKVADRRAYFKEYNDRMKEKRKLARLAKDNEKENQQHETKSKYYGAEAIRVLMSFKEYTELNKEKKQLWVDFNWTLKDCQEAFSKGFGNVVAIMKLNQVAERLISDYWDTAKNEIRKGKSWNVLSEEEKSRLIKYWGYEKARVENGYIDIEEKLKRQSEEYLKEIEQAKFHEERGKIKCPCGWCEQEAIIKGEVKAKIKKEQEQAEKDYDDYWGTSNSEKGKCDNCGKVKKLVEDTELCRSCYDYYN